MISAHQENTIQPPMGLLDAIKYIGKEICIMALGDYRWYGRASFSHILSNDTRAIFTYDDPNRKLTVPEGEAVRIVSDLNWAPFLTPQNRHLKRELKKFLRALADQRAALKKKIGNPSIDVAG